MKYKCFYYEHCLSPSSKIDYNKAKEYYNEFINDMKTEILTTLYNIEISLQKHDYNLVKVYITCIIDILLMINENDDVDKFKIFFESYTRNKNKEYNYIYRYCIENDIINIITDSI